MKLCVEYIVTVQITDLLVIIKILFHNSVLKYRTYQ